jgi:UDP-N-acetylmuramate dehydrogenase
MIDKITVSADIPRPVLQAAFGDALEFGRPLAPFTSYKTGGPARYFIAVHSPEEVAAVVARAKELSLPYFLIGGGSNLLVSDEGFDGLIVKVDVQGLAVVDEVSIESGAGEDLMALVDFATQNSLTGLEFAAGIWGSVGGAIYGNAGAFGGEIGSVTTSVTLVDAAGQLKVVTPDYCRFGYRDSSLKVTHEIVTMARFQLQKGDYAAIRDRVGEILTLRDTKHPNTGRSAGCFFKNIPDPSQPYGKLPAGKLLEESGAKNLQVGGARVFDRHANIIVNTGTATSHDIRELADRMKQLVLEKFHIELQEEVQQLGKF